MQGMRVALFVALAAVASVGSVRAQPAPTSPTGSSMPTPEHQAALKSGDFDTAIDMFGKAYKAVPLPVYLFDIAQANRKKAEALYATDPMKAAAFRDTAREYYRRFLDTHPRDEELELKARGLKARLDDQWAAAHPREEAARLAEAARAREAAMRAEQARLAEERRRQREHEDQIRTAVNRSVVESDRGKARVLEISGGAAIGAAVISAGVGIYLGVKAHRLADDLTHQDVFDQSRINQGNQAEREMVIAYAAGGVLLVGGAITLWLGHRIKERAETASTISLGMVPAPHGGGLVVRGSF